MSLGSLIHGGFSQNKIGAWGHLDLQDRTNLKESKWNEWKLSLKAENFIQAINILQNLRIDTICQVGIKALLKEINLNFCRILFKKY